MLNVIIITPISIVVQSMCMFDKFHLTFNFKSKVSHDVLKNKNECQLTSTFLPKMWPQCHMPSGVCRFNWKSLNWHVILFFTSHTTCQNLNCACQLTCILIVCKFLHAKYQKLAKTLSKIHTKCNWTPRIYNTVVGRESECSLWPLITFLYLNVNFQTWHDNLYDYSQIRNGWDIFSSDATTEIVHRVAYNKTTHLNWDINTHTYKHAHIEYRRFIAGPTLNNSKKRSWIFLEIIT